MWKRMVSSRRVSWVAFGVISAVVIFYRYPLLRPEYKRKSWFMSFLFENRAFRQ